MAFPQDPNQQMANPAMGGVPQAQGMPGQGMMGGEEEMATGEEIDMFLDQIISQIPPQQLEQFVSMPPEQAMQQIMEMPMEGGTMGEVLGPENALEIAGLIYDKAATKAQVSSNKTLGMMNPGIGQVQEDGAQPQQPQMPSLAGGQNGQF